MKNLEIFEEENKEHDGVTLDELMTKVMDLYELVSKLIPQETEEDTEEDTEEETEEDTEEDTEEEEED